MLYGGTTTRYCDRCKPVQERQPEGPPQRAFAVFHPDITNAKVGDEVQVQEILLGPAQPCDREWHFWDADVLAPISGLDNDITFRVGGR